MSVTRRRAQIFKTPPPRRAAPSPPHRNPIPKIMKKCECAYIVSNVVSKTSISVASPLTRLAQALCATTADGVNDDLKVKALMWLGFALQEGKLEHKKDFDWLCAQRGHFLQVLNPLMSDGLVNQAALQRGENAMNLLTLLCQGDAAFKQ